MAKYQFSPAATERLTKRILGDDPVNARITVSNIDAVLLDEGYVSEHRMVRFLEALRSVNNNHTAYLTYRLATSLAYEVSDHRLAARRVMQAMWHLNLYAPTFAESPDEPDETSERADGTQAPG